MSIFQKPGKGILTGSLTAIIFGCGDQEKEKTQVINTPPVTTLEKSNLNYNPPLREIIDLFDKYELRLESSPISADSKEQYIKSFAVDIHLNEIKLHQYAVYDGACDPTLGLRGQGYRAGEAITQPTRNIGVNNQIVWKGEVNGLTNNVRDFIPTDILKGIIEADEVRFIWNSENMNAIIPKDFKIQITPTILLQYQKER